MLSLAFNGLLITAVLLVANAGVPLLLVVPVFLAVSAVEALAAHTLLPAGRPAGEAAPQPIGGGRGAGMRRRQAVIDESTGLYTRWYFDRRLHEEAARCKRYDHSMAVVVLRVDVVDLTTFSLDGWQKRSLEAATRAAKVVREVDISAAISPFEFAICLVHCDREGAGKALERMKHQLADYDCEAGVAVFPDEGYEPAALVDLAMMRLRPLGPVDLSAIA
jgi:GGDEF domain-containing protein